MFDNIGERLHSGTVAAGATLIWFFAGVLVQYLNPDFFTNVGFVWIIILTCSLYSAYFVMCDLLLKNNK